MRRRTARRKRHRDRQHIPARHEIHQVDGHDRTRQGRAGVQPDHGLLRHRRRQGDCFDSAGVQRRKRTHTADVGRSVAGAYMRAPLRRRKRRCKGGRALRSTDRRRSRGAFRRQELRRRSRSVCARRSRGRGSPSANASQKSGRS